jgi:hypothetical protein
VPPDAAEQHPPLHACVAPQLFVQRCVVVSHAKSVGQSTSDLQPQNVPPDVSHAEPFVFPTHEAHIGADVVTAHAPWTLPAAHFPEVGSQQPPLHGLCMEHAAPHTPFSHACPIGQSTAELHPHVPAPTHCGPAGFAVQSTHAAPDAPQAVPAIASHVLVAPQQKPVPHTPVAPPTWQVDVHAPDAHVGVPPPHGAHAPPFEPQFASSAPATQFAPSQHPPLHVRLFAHDVEH